MKSSKGKTNKEEISLDVLFELSELSSRSRFAYILTSSPQSNPIASAYLIDDMFGFSHTFKIKRSIAAATPFSLFDNVE